VAQWRTRQSVEEKGQQGLIDGLWPDHSNDSDKLPRLIRFVGVISRPDSMHVSDDYATLQAHYNGALLFLRNAKHTRRRRAVGPLRQKCKSNKIRTLEGRRTWREGSGPLWNER